LGRVDAQVKIRGHRIELSEIEGQILAHKAVLGAVVYPRKVGDEDVQLVALLALRDAETFDVVELLSDLREVLPGYMIPQIFEHVDSIPRLPSGKVDRRGCELLHGQAFRIEREIVPPRTEMEKLVLHLWAELFPQHEISSTDDFFKDLGGYSLLASKFISQLRSDRGFTKVSVLDIYENPTIRSFASILEAHPEPAQATPEFKPVPKMRYALAKFWQAIGILFIFGLQGLFWLGPIIAAIDFSAEMGYSDFHALLLGIALHTASVPILVLIAIAIKWIVGGKFKPGSYPLWGTTFIRWWFVERILSIAPVTFVTGSPVAALYFRMLGAKIGRNTILESLEFDCPDLVEVGDDCAFEQASWIHASEVAHGELHLRRVKVGNGCSIGVRSGLVGGSVMEDGSSLRDLSCAARGMTIPAGEEWVGSVARKTDKPLLPAYDSKDQPSRGRLALFTVVQTVLVFVLTLLDSLPFVTVVFTMYNRSEGFAEYLWEPVYATVLVAFGAVQVLMIKWAVLGKLKAGTYDFPGWYWLRKWFSDKHLELASGLIVPIYDSLFARPWCIALGMKCGPRCEIALPRRMPYDLVEMGEESFLASEVSIGRPIRRNGKITLEPTTVGKRAFLGNDSVVPQGTDVPDDFLLGVLSVSPRNEQVGPEPDQAWLGSPPFKIPHRQVLDHFDPKHTYRPTPKLYAQRLAHEAVRIVLPSLCSLIVASILIEGFVHIWIYAEDWSEFPLGFALACIPLLYLAGTLVGAIICRISKRILIGTYRPTVQPLWSQFVWKTETHSTVIHDFAAPLFISDLEGTPYLSAFMKMMGARIGRRAFINTTDWTETDLINLGEDVSINSNAPLQAHLFEDRVMKVGPIKVGPRCSVGNYSVILCDSELKPDAHVGHLSLVMKGETIPSHTYWKGSPAQSVEEDTVRAIEA
ncbi:MAG: Pls/PosA family non-ribosomal peptide synthetase, partial [Fimbriimonadales bacterium]